MAARAYRIPATAIDALTNRAAFDGPRVTLTEHIGTAWPGVKTTLEKLGAVYAVGTSAFDFEPDQDARAIVADAIDAGQVMAAANAAGYVPTPADVCAWLVAQYADLTAGGGDPLRVLEPSAGTGRFVEAITRGLGPEWLRVTAVEPDARRARQIPTADGSVSVVVDTFEAFAERARAAGDRYDRVVMNPPFSVPGRPTIWAEHLRAAFELLAPGGRLVAIVPASVLDDRRAGAVRAAYELVRANGGGELLDRDTFAESGVTFASAVVWLDRAPVEEPAPVAPALGLPAFVSRPYTGAEVPVTVPRPFMTRAAALSMPVQAWRDSWRGTVRTLRYRGECIECVRPVWAFDDGENDPRGALGDNAPDLLDPFEHGAEGLPVVACFACMNDGRETYERVNRAAAAYWASVEATRDQVAAVEPVAVEPVQLTIPDVWGPTLAAL